MKRSFAHFINNTILFVLFDIVSVCIAAFVAILLRDSLSFQEFISSGGWITALHEGTVVISVFVLFNAVLGCYGIMWRLFRVVDAAKLCSSVAFSLSVCLFLAGIVDQFKIFDDIRSLVLMAICSFILMLFSRNARRISISIAHQLQFSRNKNKTLRTLIYGAGDLGLYFIDHICTQQGNRHIPTAFLDDNPILQKMRISGIPVVGNVDSLEEAIQKYRIHHVIIAIEKLPKEKVKSFFIRCKKLGIECERFGLQTDFTSASESLALRRINFEELLRREPVKLNREAVINYISGKVVCVTGGAGSIGSEICRQVLAAGAKQLIIFDNNENGLYHITNLLAETYDPERFIPLLGSVQDVDRLNRVFAKYHPELVLHAAAHKHVPMTEISPVEAVKNNIFGTVNLCRVCIDNGVKRFLLISTDKAVNPTNIMGATKRVAEIAVQMFNKEKKTEFVAVRFGNVLGSNGSVVPLFENQIKSGGPVTVTHPGMVRFFMTIPEAVSLVLQAGAMAGGGEIFVLDMGKPVKIYDLACDLIRYFGKEPGKDIEIRITGLRPGEKMFEELHMNDEQTTKTENDKIFVCRPVRMSAERFFSQLEKLEKSLTSETSDEVFHAVKQIVPTFCHSGFLEEIQSETDFEPPLIEAEIVKV